MRRREEFASSTGQRQSANTRGAQKSCPERRSEMIVVMVMMMTIMVILKQWMQVGKHQPPSSTKFKCVSSEYGMREATNSFVFNSLNICLYTIEGSEYSY
jgi:hypothetical protein